MPGTRTAALDKAALAKVSETQQNFTFPKDHHLLITTGRHIFSWDAFGIHKVFQSSKNGIAAVREAKDGSGILAIASKNVVVLHDTRRGKEESWGLDHVPEDEIRHLEYAEDAKSIYISTAADGAIQQYSAERSRILDPVQRHASTPTALAVSPTGHLMVSASSSPPVVHIKNLAQNTVSTLLQPNSTSAAIICAAFHPNRPNVFMLAFADGSVAAYDASRISRGKDGSVGNAEIASLAGVHRRTITKGLDSSRAATPIVGVAFLSGYKTRAVAAGRDGRCRIIDFANGGMILRTWHVKAPLTSIAVFAPGKDIGRSRKTEIGRDESRIRGPDVQKVAELGSTENMIAVARIDGKVHLYNDLGLLLTHQTVSAQEEKLLSLEWVKGPSPRPPEHSDVGHFTDTPSILLCDSPAFESSQSSVYFHHAPERATAHVPTRLGLPADLRPGTDTVAHRQRNFTVHPDELQDGTVRRSPHHSKQVFAVPSKSEFQDLFSPVRPQALKPSSPNRAVNKSPRHRPRISSQKFVKSFSPTAKLEMQQPENSGGPQQIREAGIHRNSGADRSAQGLTRAGFPILKPARRTSKTRLLPGATDSRRIVFDSDPFNAVDGTVSSHGDAVHDNVNVNVNAKILAELRKLSRAQGKQQGEAIFSSRRSCEGPRQKMEINEDDLDGKAYPSSRQLPEDELKLRAPCRRPEPNALQQDEGGDIWLTSESEDDSSQSRQKRPRRALVRPPARQCPRSHVNVHGTVSTVDTTVGPMLHLNDTPFGDDTDTAETPIWPPEKSSSSSQQVRDLFPRSSSLSPAQRREVKKHSATRSQAVPTAKLAQHTKSPWARLKASRNPINSAGKKSRSVRKNEFVTVLDGSLEEDEEMPRESSFDCFECSQKMAKVQALESEVVRLKAEALALKAVLRRNGLPVPAAIR